MAWVVEKFFHVHDVAAEVAARFVLCNLDRAEQCGVVVHDTHTAATTARCGLDHDRIANLFCRGEGLSAVFGHRAVGAGHSGHARGTHYRNGGHLVTHGANRVGARADEDEAAALNLFGEIRVL